MRPHPQDHIYRKPPSSMPASATFGFISDIQCTTSEEDRTAGYFLNTLAIS